MKMIKERETGSGAEKKEERREGRGKGGAHWEKRKSRILSELFGILGVASILCPKSKQRYKHPTGTVQRKTD